MYLARKVPAAVNLRPLEVYRALPASPEQVCRERGGEEGPAGSRRVSLPSPIKPVARNDSRAHENSFQTSGKKNLAERRNSERKMRTHRARAGGFARKKFRIRIFVDVNDDLIIANYSQTFNRFFSLYLC